MERVLDERLTNPALNGTPVALSIDTRVQAAMESELGRAMTDVLRRAGAAGIVLDVDDRRGDRDGLAADLQPQPRRHVGQRTAAQHHDAERATSSARRSSRSRWRPRSTPASSRSMARRFDATQPLQVGALHDPRRARRSEALAQHPRDADPFVEHRHRADRRRGRAARRCRRCSASWASTPSPISNCARRAARCGRNTGRARRR